MRADDALGSRQSLGDAVNGNDGGVRRQYGRGRSEPHQIGEDRLLELELLRSRLRHEVGVPNRQGQIIRDINGLRDALIELAEAQRFGDPRANRCAPRGSWFEDDHGVTGARKNLRNACAHQAAADDRYGPRSKHL
jgi:hypothetical protein